MVDKNMKGIDVYEQPILNKQQEEIEVLVQEAREFWDMEIQAVYKE